jgi:poly(3-hydroxybutyrate) depolymerase
MSTSKLTGRLEYFRSGIDGTEAPCAVCATDTTDEPKPLIVEVSPGAMKDLPGCVSQVEDMARVAADHGLSCVALRATGRGSGSVYQNYGEVDVLEAIEHVKAHYAIDDDRISVTGASMGGAATWYLISHYPDVFAAAAPYCGYCDYRLWEKPGGSTFHMHEWEEASWRARSAVFLIDNLASGYPVDSPSHKM